MEIGTIAHPVLVAILNAPSLNGSRLNSSPLFRVPSGKMQMEIPFLHGRSLSKSFSNPLLDSHGRGKGSIKSASRWTEAVFFHFFLGNISGQPAAAGVCEQDVKKAAVISDKEYRFIRTRSSPITVTFTPVTFKIVLNPHCTMRSEL